MQAETCTDMMLLGPSRIAPFESRCKSFRKLHSHNLYYKIIHLKEGYSLHKTAE